MRYRRLLVGLVLVLTLLAGCRGDDKQAAAPTAATGETPAATDATPTPAATPAPRERLAGVEVTPLQRASEQNLPADLALIVARSCYKCDGGWVNLTRVYLDAAGKARIDGLRRPADGPASQGNFQGLAARADGGDLVVSVCVRGYCGGLNEPSPDARSALWRSTDGGVGWTQLAQEDGGLTPLLIVRDQVLVVGPFRAGASGPPPLRLLPSGAPVSRPSGVDADWNAPAAVVGEGDLVWLADGRQKLLRSDGGTLLAPTLGAADARIIAVTAGPRPGQWLILWQTGTPSGNPLPVYLGIFEGDGKLAEAYRVDSQVYSWQHAVRVLDENRLLVTAIVSSGALAGQAVPPIGIGVPAIIERGSGKLSPIAKPFAFDLPDQLGLSWIMAVPRGPFARVVNTGDCLNIRSAPDRTAPAGGCAADGVLLRPSGETREASGLTWQRVVTPAGIAGWASAEFLER